MTSPSPAPSQAKDQLRSPWPATWLALFFALLAWAATRWTPRDWVEDVYATRVFPPLRASLSGVASWVPFSLAEGLIVAGSVWLLVLLGRGTGAWWRGSDGRAKIVGSGVAGEMLLTGHLRAL